VDGPWVHGIPRPGGGSRTDLEEIKAKLDAGTAETTIAEDHFSNWVRYHKSFHEYKRIKETVRNFKTEVFLRVGAPGTGKTEAACIGDHYIQHGKWWDGYHGQEICVLDEFKGWHSFDMMNKLMDKQACTVEIKGGTANFISKVIVITSNYHPMVNWYSEPEKRAWGSFKRRIEHIIYHQKDREPREIEWDDMDKFVKPTGQFI